LIITTADQAVVFISMEVANTLCTATPKFLGNNLVELVDIKVNDTVVPLIVFTLNSWRWLLSVDTFNPCTSDLIVAAKARH